MCSAHACARAAAGVGRRRWDRELRCDDRTLTHGYGQVEGSLLPAQALATGAGPGRQQPLDAAMPEGKSLFREVLPKQGQLSVEDVATMVLCKPKLLPLKSVTLEKLEKMQRAAQETIRQQEVAQREQQQQSQQ
ncbi:BBSome-interacting protein 1 [Emys orbicularis]